MGIIGPNQHTTSEWLTTQERFRRGNERGLLRINEVQFCVARRTRALGNGLSKRGLQTIQVTLEALIAYVIYNDS